MDSNLSISDTSCGNLQDLQNTHGTRVLKLMNEQRKVNSKLCDVVLVVDDLKISAHRSVLAACSPYFYAMFNAELLESKQKTVHLRDLHPEMLELLIDFAYSGKLEVTVENAQPLLSISSIINFPEVREICYKFLEMQLDPLNCLGIRNFAETYGCMRFIEEVDQFIISHFSEVILSEEYISVSHGLLLKCLSSEELNVNSEREVYDSVLKWARHDIASRKHLLTSLLRHVRMPLLPVNYLLQEVDHEPLVRADHDRRDLLDEAKNYHLLPDQRNQCRSERTIPRKSTAGLLFAVGGKEAGETITTKVEYFR